MNMRLEQLAPLVDPERDPWLNIESCFEILLEEGWSFGQVRMWVNLAFLLREESLVIALRERCN